MVFIKNILPSIVTIVEDGTLTFEFIHTDDQKADLFTLLRALHVVWIFG